MFITDIVTTDLVITDIVITDMVIAGHHGDAAADGPGGALFPGEGGGGS
jgi:hypothetical protein